MYTKKKANLESSIEQSYKLTQKNEDKIIKLLSKNTQKKNISRDWISLNKSGATLNKSILKIKQSKDIEEASRATEKQLTFESSKKNSTVSLVSMKINHTDQSPKTKLKNLIDNHGITQHKSINLSSTKVRPLEGTKHTNKLYKSQNPGRDSPAKTISSVTTIEFPIKVQKSFLKLTNFLTKQELEEIRDYETVYYINLDEKALK